MPPITQWFRHLPLRADIGCVRNMIALYEAIVQDLSLALGGCEASYQHSATRDALDSLPGCVIPCVCMNTVTRAPLGGINRQAPQAPIKVRYCLYARKSTESEERQ